MNDSLISWAKSQLPEPSNYGCPYCAPHNFTQGKRVMFKRVNKPSSTVDAAGWMWEFVEVLDIRKEDYSKKNTETMW